MTEQERLAAALEYQQAQQPARMNPNLAAQGARGRANMMPPTSIMDERYPAFKRNQEDAEKLMLGLDIVGSAIPLAGPAMKGAKVLGQHAAPQLAQALENYTFKTGMALPMDVYHGTPHRFAATAKNPLGEFDPTKIGSGEGAQAYGYGHYLAESPKVATDYRNVLSGNHNLDQFQFTVNGNPTDSAVAKAIVRAGSPEAFIKGMQPKLDSLTEKATKASKEELIPGLSDHDIAMLELKSHKAMIDEAKGYIGKTVKSEPLGTLYKVDLPDEVVPRMLDWDKPLSDQPAEVRKFLSNVSFNPPNQEQKIGEWLKPRLAEGMAPNWADDMRKAGIPGIQYLDAGSRGASTGTRNFVVFPGNEGLLNILGRE